MSHIIAQLIQSYFIYLFWRKSICKNFRSSPGAYLLPDSVGEVGWFFPDITAQNSAFLLLL